MSGTLARERAQDMVAEVAAVSTPLPGPILTLPIPNQFLIPSLSLPTCILKSVLLFFSYSQYPNLWSVSNSTISPVSQSGGMSNGLGSQFLRGSTTHYPTLPHPVTTTSSGSPLYDSGTPTDVADSQYDTSVHARLASTWTPVTTPSM